MSVFQKIKLFYNNNKIAKYFFQFVVLLLIYFSIRGWQSINDIKGAAPIVLDKTLSGEMFDLRDRQSRPVLVHFWATWCPICQFENSNIENIAKDYQVITIASWSESKKAVGDYLIKENLKIPVIVDEDGEWAKVYGVKAVPASFIIDAKGDIQFIEKGYTSELGLRLRLWWLE